MTKHQYVRKGISGVGISRGETEADPSTKEEVRLPHSPLPSTLGQAALPTAEQIVVYFSSFPGPEAQEDCYSTTLKRTWQFDSRSLSLLSVASYHLCNKRKEKKKILRKKYLRNECEYSLNCRYRMQNEPQQTRRW